MSQTLETVRATTAELRIHRDGTEVVVSLDRDLPDQADLPAISARLEIPAERRTEEYLADLWVEELSYPECTEAGQSYEDLVGAEALSAAIREVGDTAIAHRTGMADYLAVARRVAVFWRPRGVVLEVYPMTFEETTGSVAADLAAGPPTRLSLSVTSGATAQEAEEIAEPEIFTWPSTAAPSALPELTDEPVLALALRLLGGAE